MAYPAHAVDGDTELVKVSVLAKLSGVPAATIKHYVREGLLPEPVRTSRNMAYYDPQLVERIQRIKELQRTRFLPLKVIKTVLDESELDNQDETVTAAIARVLAQTAGDERTREQLLQSGVVSAQLEMLTALGVVRPIEGREEETYTGDDVEIMRVLRAARKAGLTEGMLPVEILADYARSLAQLVEIELRLFRDSVIPSASPDQLPALTESAVTLSERLVVLIRRKMLVPTMRQLAETARAEAEAPEDGDD